MEEERFYDLDELKAHQLNKLCAESRSSTALLCGFTAGILIGLTVITAFFLALAGGTLLGLGMMGTGFARPAAEAAASGSPQKFSEIISVMLKFSYSLLPYILALGIIGAVAATIRKRCCKQNRKISFFYGFFQFDWDQLFFFILLLIFSAGYLASALRGKQIVFAFTGRGPDEYSFWLISATCVLVSAFSAGVLHLWWWAYYRALLQKFN